MHQAPPLKPLPLSDESLPRLAPAVAVPRYDRARVVPGVVHLSVGSFHRSHQAVYFDDLAALGARDWGIVGVGLRRPELHQALAPQDGLYTVVARDAAGDHARVIGAMTRFLFAPEQDAAVLSALSDERTSLVTLTITADAYGPDAWVDPDPASALGYVAAALDVRRRAGLPPFTVLSCDNVPRNGDAARRAIAARGRLRSEQLGDWIEEHVAFPNSMVDRITPRATAEDRRWIAREFGVLDRAPVVTEPFSQWILEDSFCNRRPALDEVGACFVPDVAPYALMKTRLLNATHCAIAFLGSVAGLERADEVMGEPVFASYVQELMDVEVSPLLLPVPGVDLEEYKETLVERLSNPAIGDSLERLARAGSSKIPAHVLPSIVAAGRRGAPRGLLTLAVAAWLRYLAGRDERGRELSLDDPAAARLQKLRGLAATDPRAFVRESRLFGELAHDEQFLGSLERAVAAIGRGGVRAAVASRLTSGAPVAA